MRLINFLRTAVFIILVRNTPVLSSPADTSISDRLAESDLAKELSGTLTITVAPDPTCGYEGIDDPALVCQGRPCTWELSRHARVFCGWTSLRKTCLDSWAYSNTELCDSRCRANKITYSCISSDAPYCLRVRLGNGIIHYTCHSTIASSDITIKTTKNFEEREFSTFVVVDGRTVETISGSTTEPTTETTTGPTAGLTTGGTGGSSNPPVGAIVGGVVGGVAVIGLIVLGVFGLRILGRRRSGNQATPSPTPGSPVQEDTHTPNAKVISASSKPPELYG